MLKQIQRTIAIVVFVCFLGSSIQPPAYAQVDPMPWMPKPGTMVPLSPEFSPAYLKGIVVHPEDPFKFDFIIYKGDKPLTYAQKKEEYTKLTKYFLASLAIPDDDQWVNLSPYEKGRIIKDDFGKTEMGRDLLAQDYLLKQITASLIYPEGKTGREFWNKVYTEARKQFGTTNIPIDTFNKVWIVPDNAEVFEKGPMAYCDKSHLKVMLEEDYLSLKKHTGISTVIPAKAGIQNTHSLASKIIKQIILPELQSEVNSAKNFALLRQVFSGVILAAWYKKVLKESFLGKVYTNKSRLKGIDQDPRNNQIIYQHYLRAFKKGVFNFIKEDIDAYSHEAIPRKYFSGGTQMNFAIGTFHHGPATTAQLANAALASSQEDVIRVIADEVKNTSDAAMTIDDISDQELSELTHQLFENYGESMDFGFSHIPTQEKFIKELKWLAAYVSPLFDKTKQALYKKAIVQALRTPNSKTAEDLALLYERIQGLHLLIGSNIKSVEQNFMLGKLEYVVQGTVMKLITEEDLIQLYESQIIRMKDMPKSSLFPEADYEQWARRIIAVGDVDKLADIFEIEAYFSNGKHTLERPLYSATDLLFAFLKALPLEQQQDIAGKIVRHLNDPAHVELVSYGDYETLIDALPRKVGMFTNDRVLEHLYKEIAIDDFPEIEADEGPGEDAEERFLVLSGIHERPLFDFMLYNPSPSALKIAIKTWHWQGAITDTELNKFSWLTAMVPKESGNTRDRRRQIHRYLIRLIQYRRTDNKSIADFMSRILRAVDNRLFDRENINELLNFMLEFTNLGVDLQRGIMQKAEALISEWQYEVQGEKPRPPKEFLAPTHFKLLRDFMTKEVIEGMISSLETFDAKQKKDLYAHIRKYPAAWNRLGFLDTISSYIAFQNPEGKIQTEKLLKQLMRSKVEGDRFISKERYKGMKFDREIINRWRQSVSVDLPIPANFDDARKLSYEGVRQDLLLHAGIQSTGDWGRDKKQLQQHFASLITGLDDEQQIRAKEELITLIHVLEEVVLQLNEGHAITSDQIQRWKKRLMPKGEIEPPFWYRQNISMREMIVNLDQIGQIKPLDIAEIQRITFNVQDDPQVFVRSFLEPFPTCQRCTEPTRYNKEGQPINRARQGQFLVATISIEYKDGHSEIVTRAQLELAKGKSLQLFYSELLQAISEIDSGSRAGINRMGETVLLVERLYSGLFPKQVIQNEIVKWASADGSFLNDVIFADPFNGEQFLTDRIYLEFLESDGIIYRDTYQSSGIYSAWRVDKGGLKESVVPDRAMGGASKNLGGIDFNAVHLRLQIKRDGRGVPLPLAQQDMAQLSKLEGLEPHILSIVPASQSAVFQQLVAH